MRWATLSLGTYLLGILVFLTVADFSNVNWINSYYIWDKAKDFLLIATIYDLLHRIRKVTRWVLYYSLIRLVWEITSILTGLTINSNAGIKLLFISLLIGLTALLLNDLKEWQRQK